MLQPLQIPKCKWEQISMDFITGLNKTKNGFDSIYVVIDYLSKRGHFIPCTINITGTEVAKLFINNIYKLHGLPKVIISDRVLEITICYVKKGLCISKRKEEFIYTRNRHIGPACAPSIDRGVQNQA